MKKILFLVALVATVFSFTACTRETTEEAPGIADLNDTERKAVTLQIGIDNVDMGVKIVEKFKADYPNSFVNLEFVEKESADLTKNMSEKQEAEVDIALVIGGEVIGYEPNFAPLTDSISSVKTELHSDLQNIGGSSEVYVPAFYDGMAFSYNHNFMTQILGENYDVDATTKLPTAFNTWEKIMAYSLASEAASGTGIYSNGTWDGTTFTATEGDQTFTEVFPVSIQEPWSGYSLLTNAGFHHFPTSNGDDFGYSTEEFKKGLELITELKNNRVAYGQNAHLLGADMGWRWDNMLDGKYLFGQVGTWMDVNGKETENNINIKFSFMPTYKGIQGAPFIKTKGFVVNNFSGKEKIEAAKAVVKWLYTKETMQVMVDNSSYLTSHNADASITPTYTSDNATEMIYALSQNETEKTHKLSQNNTMAAMDIYYNEVNKTIMAKLWDGELTPEEAQQALINTQTVFIDENKK